MDANKYRSVYLVAKKELSDRNTQIQKRYNAPNIPEGTKFFAFWHQIPKFKFVVLEYNHHKYEVKASDLEIAEIENNDYCTYNHVCG